MSRASSGEASDSDNDVPLPTLRTSLRNNICHLSVIRHSGRGVTSTARHQLQIATRNIHRYIPHADVSNAGRFLVAHSAHDYPPSLSFCHCAMNPVESISTFCI